jgi:hypothetical protein
LLAQVSLHPDQRRFDLFEIYVGDVRLAWLALAVVG